jgi:hypothetical protein
MKRATSGMKPAGGRPDRGVLAGYARRPPPAPKVRGVAARTPRATELALARWRVPRILSTVDRDPDLAKLPSVIE